MDRRSFLTGLSAAGLASILDPRFIEAKQAIVEGKPPEQPVPQRVYGSTGQKLSIIGMGGIVVMNVTPNEAADYVAEAVDRGVNYFDVAPSYGNAEERLGPALKPYRERCFLACKTMERVAKGAQEELDRSLERLQTDHFDLYQFHALTELKDVEQIFAPGGAMEVVARAKQAGRIRHIGFSAHSEAAAHAALDQFDFDSILFPLNFAIWHKGEFGPSLHARAVKNRRGILALKAMAHQSWPGSIKKQNRPWKKAWYQPLDKLDQAALGLRFTLGLPSDALIPPGHWELFKLALDLAQAGALTPLIESESEALKKLAAQSQPIFKKA